MHAFVLPSGVEIAPTTVIGMTVQVDTSAIEDGLKRISHAFEYLRLNRAQTRTLIAVLREGVYVHDCAEAFAYELRWRDWAVEAMERVLG